MHFMGFKKFTNKKQKFSTKNNKKDLGMACQSLPSEKHRKKEDAISTSLSPIPSLN